jgi:hypothetical protein
MTREECVTLIYNECMRIDKHKKTIVCCFNSRKVMQDFIQAFFDKFIYVRGTKINLSTVSNFFSTHCENTNIYMLLDGCKNLDGINPDIFISEEGFYYSNIVEVLRHKLLAVKNSQFITFNCE